MKDELGFRVFAFRLHQFISLGETVFATLEPEGERFLSTQGQRFAPGDRERILLPLAFCRECGQEYYTVWLRGDGGIRRVSPRELRDLQGEEDGEPGFLFLSTRDPWPVRAEELVERLPEVARLACRRNAAGRIEVDSKPWELIRLV